MMGSSFFSRYKPPITEIGKAVAVQTVTLVRVGKPGVIITNFLEDLFTRQWKVRSSGLLKPIE